MQHNFADFFYGKGRIYNTIQYNLLRGFYVGLLCQYHSQVIGWKDSSPK